MHKTISFAWKFCDKEELNCNIISIFLLHCTSPVGEYVDSFRGEFIKLKLSDFQGSYIVYTSNTKNCCRNGAGLH